MREKHIGSELVEQLKTSRFLSQVFYIIPNTIALDSFYIS